MHIQNFKTFCDLVETKSFSKAARLNDYTIKVSQQLKAMETHYDMLIIDRNQKNSDSLPKAQYCLTLTKKFLVSTKNSTAIFRK